MTLNNPTKKPLSGYIARLYEKIVDSKTLYASTQMTIPRPLFYVLYNGIEDYPEQKTLKLSSMFSPSEENSFPLELEVKVYNINKGNLRLHRSWNDLGPFTLQYPTKKPLVAKTTYK